MIDYWPFIMAGGGGTRFWPRSRQNNPKQFINIVGTKPLLRQIADLLVKTTEPQRIRVITNILQAGGSRERLPEIPATNIIAEPVGRNTAPCIGLAALLAQSQDKNAVVGIFPADHCISPVAEFQRTVVSAVELAAKGKAIITIGISPTFPATGYGYIEHGKLLPEAKLPSFAVKRFTEKPDLKQAEDFLAAGSYSWNAGMFFFQAEVVLAELERQQPEIYTILMRLQKALGTANEAEALKQAYAGMPSLSFDYAVMENAANVYVVKSSFNWDDVGSWAALARHLPEDAAGNVIKGNAITIDSKNNTIDSQRLVALIGVENLIIVDTPDALLVCSRDRAEDVKKVVAELKKQGRDDLL